MRPLPILIALACVGIGFLAGRITSPTMSAPRAPGRERETVVLHEPPAPPPAVADAAARPSARALLEGEGGPLVEEEIARRAAEIRARALLTADHAEDLARAEVEREIRAERAFLADAARGGTMALLRNLERKWTPTWELLSAPERFGALFALQTQPTPIAGPALDPRNPVLADGTVMQYPAGRYALETQGFRRMDPFPKDLVLEGRGMDETLLVLSSDLDMRSEVASLTFRDLTLHCNDNYLESMRNNPYTLRLERCRVIGFDMGAGGSDMLSGSVGAFYATDCRIEACFGRAPGFGNLFDVRGALLARLERCVIVGPFRSVYRDSRKAAQLFAACRFERMDPGMRAHLEHPKPAARFIECTFDYLPPGAPTPERRPVSDLNPAWAE